MNFLVGVLSSVVAAMILFVTGTWRSKVVRRAVTAVASTFLGVEVKYVFPDGKATENEIKEGLKRAQRIRIFAGRGNEFQGDLYLDRGGWRI